MMGVQDPMKVFRDLGKVVGYRVSKKWMVEMEEREALRLGRCEHCWMALGAVPRRIGLAVDFLGKSKNSFVAFSLSVMRILNRHKKEQRRSQ
jgi:hypothetical protein